MVEDSMEPVPRKGPLTTMNQPLAILTYHRGRLQPIFKWHSSLGFMAWAKAANNLSDYQNVTKLDKAQSI